MLLFNYVQESSAQLSALSAALSAQRSGFYENFDELERIFSRLSGTQSTHVLDAIKKEETML